VRILIAGVDGYLGWPLALTLAGLGHEVGGIDAYYRRDWVAEMGSQSATPLPRMTARLHAFHETFGDSLDFRRGDLRDYNVVLNVIRAFAPEAVVHLGEQPSAAYSMIDVQHAVYTQSNNIVGTLNILFAMREACPRAHLVKLGTMGEYGTPNVDIPEGFFTIEYRGRTDTLPFPRQAGSWYHQSKVHDSHNVAMACRLWGLRSTDIMQGVVYGSRVEAMVQDERLVTRFDFDQCFGTAINRFCAQAVIGRPLTPYGRGGQRRGFLPLRDAVQCLVLTLLHPPADGEYRVFNQFEETYSVFELAEKVKKVGDQLGLDVEIRATENPRIEREEHHYRPDREQLLRLGYRPTRDMEGEMRIVLEDLIRYRDRIAARQRALLPDIRWDGRRQKVRYLC
jgi:UDP-sulfoquinovose synthase